MQELEQAIRERAYHLWVADGCHDGKADAHWLTAQREVLASSIGGIAPAQASKAKPVAKKKQPAAKRKSKAA